ncbi:C45 family autoproteolytic acyltransferase/hydolase [Ornithinimicrobium faecis]|uniref:C45 family autoproteolytic acyltransferase/hydolase n=1 Tax=Ornithinimicrobium faecis TaxID=2934158 RepID=UPI00211781BB|nr:C45 family peptidase [Ornithinimicrobium sp. HY1745]
MIIELHGDNREIGRQHARGAIDMREEVASSVRSAAEAHPLTDATVRAQVDEVVRAWEDLTPATLEQIAGMADVYDLPADGLLVAALGTYLRCLDRTHGPAEGCTTFATTGSAPLLVKNRDNVPGFVNRQTVLRVRPTHGHQWLALSTAGAPGVHSSGMNEFGLSVADTHVPSTDVGPGVPRFASMMHLLEQCTTTGEAVDYLLGTPQMGLGNLTLLDAGGESAVVECGYRSTVVAMSSHDPESSTPGGVLATNHHITPALATCLLEPPSNTPASNSRARHEVVETFLTRPEATFDLASVQSLVASHVGDDGVGDIPGSVCQHGPNVRSETISTTIFDPVARHLDLCLGRPCSDEYTRIPVTV